MRTHIDTEDFKMRTEIVIKDVLVAFVTMDSCGAISRDSSKLQSDCMLRLFVMLDTMIVTARTIIKATSATKITAMHAEPEIGLKITVSALGVRLDVDVTSDKALIKVVRAWTSVQLELPFRDRALVVGRLRQEDRVDRACDGGIGEGQLFLAHFTMDTRQCVVLVSVGVDAPRLADGQLRDLLRCWLLLTFGRRRLGD